MNDFYHFRLLDVEGTYHGLIVPASWRWFVNRTGDVELYDVEHNLKAVLSHDFYSAIWSADVQLESA